jgi:hypothetical protein
MTTLSKEEARWLLHSLEHDDWKRDLYGNKATLKVEDLITICILHNWPFVHVTTYCEGVPDGWRSIPFGYKHKILRTIKKIKGPEEDKHVKLDQLLQNYSVTKNMMNRRNK